MSSSETTTPVVEKVQPQEQSTLAPSGLPLVSIVIPMRNEERYIGPCLRSLLQQTYPLERCEILVVDGNSNDRSLEVIKGFQAQATIRVLENPACIVPTAMNIGIRGARGEIIVRMDAHSTYPTHYIETCVSTLQRTGADNVGGFWINATSGSSFGARLVTAVLASRFGVGGNTAYRTATEEGYVDTVPFGAFPKKLFERIGLYDEALGRNEDNELNARIRKMGGKVFFTPKLYLHYYPADNFGRMLNKNYQSSVWHLFTVFNNPGSMSLRHLIPGCFVLSLIVLSALLFVTPLAGLGLAVVLALYFSAAIYFSLRAAKEQSLGVLLAMPFAFFIFHLSYGLGTLAGIKYLFRQPIAKPTK